MVAQEVKTKAQKGGKDGRSVVCAFCNKSFKFRSTLRQHEKIHYGIKQHECEICHRLFLHKGTLTCHLRLHTGETPYKCPHCPKAFRGQTALNCHVFRHTKEGVKCPQCSMIFATSSIVKQHLKQVHTEERSHICNVCGMAYKHLKSLRIHLRNHQKRVCPDCGNGFDSVYAMLKHRKRHIEEGLPFKCGFCDRAFEKECDLEAHGRLRGRQFQCDICCHSFNKQVYLENHNRRIHWKALGLERLKVAEPKNGWNRKGVPKSKGRKRVCVFEDGASIGLHPKDSCNKVNGIEENQAEDINIKASITANDKTLEYAAEDQQPHIQNAIVECTKDTLEEGDELTELILIEGKDLVDLEFSLVDNTTVASEIVENPLEMEIETIKQVKYEEKDADLVCSFCGLLCNGDAALKHHKCVAKRTSNTNTESLICELCGNWYASAATLSIHRTNQHNRQRFKCDQCDRTFGFRCYLEKHVSTHHQNKRIACELCDKSFKYAQDLKVHMRHHNDSKPFKCDKCPSAFRFPSALRCHRILHEQDLPFGCDICGKKFRFNNSLRVHKRLHVGKKEFKCDVCEREFSTKAPLLRHIKVHSNGKQLSCTVCGSVFYKKVDLAIHESKEHPKHDLLGKGNTIHKCELCGKEFIKKSNLKAHSYIHEDVYRFPCQMCNQSFKQYAGLRTHRINVHKQLKGVEKCL